MNNAIANNKEINYAGFWIRVAAHLIDGAFLAMILIPMTFALMAYGNYYNITAIETGKDFIGLVYFLIHWVLPTSIILLFWSHISATPGKLLLGIRIINVADGSKPGLVRCIVRYLAYIPAFLLCGIGIFWVAFDKRKQGWHDKLAGTAVVYIWK